MKKPSRTYPALHALQALLGDALTGLALPDATAEALEHALNAAEGSAPLSAFFAQLHGSMRGHTADGQPWHERRLSDTRMRALAAGTRCLAAVSACGRVLLAAQAARELDDAQAQCPPQVEEGLLHAVVVLADHAGALVASDACAGP